MTSPRKTNVDIIFALLVVICHRVVGFVVVAAAAADSIEIPSVCIVVKAIIGGSNLAIFAAWHVGSTKRRLVSCI